MAAKWLVIAPSVGTVGDRCGNAPAETINGLFESEVVHRRIPWRNSEAVEYAALEWVDRFITRHLLEPIGNIPPAEAEADLYAALDADAVLADPASDEGNAGARGHGASFCRRACWNMAGGRMFRRRRARADRKNP